MITGDSPYTAADVSRRLGMSKIETLLMSHCVKDNKNWGFVWRSGISQLFLVLHSLPINILTSDCPR